MNGSGFAIVEIFFEFAVGPNGVYNMSPADHLGLEERLRVMTQIVDGKMRLVQ
jgi:hypothetical protein